MRSHLLTADDPRWQAALSEVQHDFYHLPDYVRLCARQESGEARALYVTDGERWMLLPLILRHVADGQRDATSPYGYPGPLTTDPLDAGFLTDTLTEGVQHLQEHGIVSLFVRLHPLLNQVLPSGIGTLVRHGDTVVVDLTLPDEVIWQETRKTHRYHIRRSLREGFRVIFDDDWAHEADWRRIYRQTMIRLSADASYFFDDSYFDDLKAALGDSLHLAVVEREGDVAAGALFVETCGIVQYHLAGADDRYLTNQPTKLLLDQARMWAKARGNKWFHLGGGLGAVDDSLLHFKAGFSPRHQPFHTLRIVVMEEAYRRLARERNPGRDASDLSDFFPVYRRT